jgi:predicted nucleotidyltransferase
MGTTIEERQLYSDERFEKLRSELKEAPAICADKACVYAIGSFGRREASSNSDVDLFIVSLGADKNHCHWLSKLDEILLKADLIGTTRRLGFPAFSREGKFLQHHTAQNLIDTTGTEDDDATNTFTARLLLLLESRPLLGGEIHKKTIDDVIAKYWKEFPDHTDCFMPAYLANDILRYWRTLCLNYEARTSEETPNDRAKRKLANYKLKHSRMLTCYSALLFLLDAYVQRRTVTPEDAREMVALTPTSRIGFVAHKSTNQQLTEVANDLLGLYERFLLVTTASQQELIQIFSDPDQRKKLREEQSRFGDLVYEALHSIGKGDRFYRRLVV